MITEDKVTEIFCMADDFCTFFDAMVAKYTLVEFTASHSQFFSSRLIHSPRLSFARRIYTLLLQRLSKGGTSHCTNLIANTCSLFSATGLMR